MNRLAIFLICSFLACPATINASEKTGTKDNAADATRNQVQGTFPKNIAKIIVDYLKRKKLNVIVQSPIPIRQNPSPEQSTASTATIILRNLISNDPQFFDYMLSFKHGMPDSFFLKARDVGGDKELQWFQGKYTTKDKKTYCLEGPVLFADYSSHPMLQGDETYTSADRLDKASPIASGNILQNSGSSCTIIPQENNKVSIVLDHSWLIDTIHDAINSKPIAQKDNTRKNLTTGTGFVLAARAVATKLYFWHKEKKD